MRFGTKYYFQPTPKHVRILGDLATATGTIAGSTAVLNAWPKLGVAIWILSAALKFLSNFFASNPPWDSKMFDPAPDEVTAPLRDKII